jgi:hypothetical protein
MTLLLGHLPRTHPAPPCPPACIAPTRSSTTNPLTLEPVLPFQTSARFQRPYCAGSLWGELDISSCSMWATELRTLRKFIENTVEWNRAGLTPFPELPVYVTSHIANGRRRSDHVLFDKQRNAGFYEGNVALFDRTSNKHVGLPRKNMVNLKLACLESDFT